MLKDTDYFRETRALILSERERMFARLSHMDGYKPYAAYGNFILVRILKEGLTSFDVFEAAIKKPANDSGLFILRITNRRIYPFLYYEP